MKLPLTILLLITAPKLFAQPTTTDILQKAERYYNSLQTFSITVGEKIKTAIAERTDLNYYDCYIDRPNKTELFPWYLVRAGNEYAIHYDDSSFIPVSQKKSSI